MELPIGTIETLVNCKSQRKKRSSLKRFQLPRNTSPKRKSAKNITTDLRSLACLLWSLFRLHSHESREETANKKTIDESLYLHRCESRRHFCSQKSSTLVFFSFIFSASGTAIRVWIEVTILQMKVQTVNDPLQCQRVSTKPTNFFLF